MDEKFGLPYLEAITKAFKIVKRDMQLSPIEEKVFSVKAQIQYLTDFYLTGDPDTYFKKLTLLEPNKAVLREEAIFLMRMFYVLTRVSPRLQSREQFFDMIRNQHLNEKYELRIAGHSLEVTCSVAPITCSFPIEDYKLKLENTSFCRPLPDAMKKYLHFKKEYATESIFGLLPAGKKFGGFIKAYLRLNLQLFYENVPGAGIFGVQFLRGEISKLRSIYNSNIFSQDERVKWFDKLNIKAEDCALWSRLFDEQFSGFKRIHIFFGQIE